MLDFQSHLIFPVHAVAAPGPLPPSAERLSVRTPGGEHLEGIHFPRDSPNADRALILAFGGNAWNAQDVAEYLHELYPEHHVVAFHYRGYPPSTGSPSAEALIADAPLVYDAAVERVKPSAIIAVGLSIGSAVAAQLYAKRKLDGIILVTPFDSLKALAQSMYPWLPIGAIFNHQIDAAGPLRNAKVRSAIIAAERDEIVPATRTNALRQALAGLVFDRTLTGAGHNDIYGRSDFHESMREAFEAVSH